MEVRVCHSLGSRRLKCQWQWKIEIKNFSIEIPRNRKVFLVRARRRKTLNFRMVRGRRIVCIAHKSSWISIYLGCSRRRKRKYRCAGVIGVIKFMGRNKSKEMHRKSGKEMLISTMHHVHVYEHFLIRFQNRGSTKLHRKSAWFICLASKQFPLIARGKIGNSSPKSLNWNSFSLQKFLQWTI